MATYKAEFLAQHYARRLRPAAHYSMGWLPLWALGARPVAPLANAAGSAPGMGVVLERAAGVDRRRTLPKLSHDSFQRWFHRRRDVPDGPRRGEVVLWPDTFTNRFDPHIGRAAVAVLEAAGWRVRVPRRPVCCGLTWISTGQLAMARRVLRRSVALLRDHVRAGGFVVGLEPSCTAVFRSDAVELLADEDTARLRDRTRTLAELLLQETPGWEPPARTGAAVVQTHCHHHAVLGFEPDLAVLRGTGLDVEVPDSGCCGLAGNFGFERGHFDVSMACAERVLLPAVRKAGPDAVVLADGFSCRTQIAAGLDGRRARHLAEVLAPGHDDDTGEA